MFWTPGKVSHDELIDRLANTSDLEDNELIELICNMSKYDEKYLAERADAVRQEHYGKDVYIRGLIEFTNYCKNDCYYCGIRKSNGCLERYRLSREDILKCCKEGYALGFRTFVLQGGEDPYFSDERICETVSEIKKLYPDCAVTLSIGEKSRKSYQQYYDAGADRYLLRHETADNELYGMLHPDSLSLENRKRCLYDLKDIGFQVGCGMMIGAPYQKVETLVEDLRFMQDLGPHMIGIGPFIPHKDTDFRDKGAGSLEDTLHMISILRLMFPNALIPATTALGTIDPIGREKGIMSGANVIMPNLSPSGVRDKYLLYDNKICVDDEATECKACTEIKMNSIGYNVVVSRGDIKQ